MTDTTENVAPTPESSEPAAGLYVFYDAENNIQIGVSGDYSIGEAIFMLNAAKAKLELLQFQVLRSQQPSQSEKSRIILPS